MSNIILGVDPGASGAIAILTEGYLTEVFDVPIFEINKKKQIDIYQLAQKIDALNKRGKIDQAFIEKVHALPKQGVSSCFNFGASYGVIQGILAANFIPINFVTPNKWKSHFKLGRDKDQSRQKASALWPLFVNQFSRKKDDGRAEAALIARWGYEELT